MAGEIHGLISREDMWRMWAPYGERVELDGDLNPDNITTTDALQVMLGSNDKWFYRIWGTFYDENRQEVSWQDGLREAILNPSEELIESLVGSSRKQQQFAKEAREKAIAGGLELAGQLGAAAHLLVSEGLFTSRQADTIDTWLVAPDGQPFMQYTPMSRLEYGRLALRYDKEDCDLTGNDCTDFSLGILRSAISLRKATRPWRVHNRIHESVHGSFSGIEAWDITRDDGWRHPEATVIGHFAYEPTTEVKAGDDFSEVENCEVNEGWTEFIARSLMSVNSTLGKPLKLKDGYGKWAKTMATIQKNDPGLFAVITDAALAEATPQCPDAKREALADMHVYATRRLGGTTLDQLFLESGGSLLDIFTKGKEKAV